MPIDRLGTSPRLVLLKQEAEQIVLKPLRSHGWVAEISYESSSHDLVEITARKGGIETRLAVLYSSSGISNEHYRELGSRVDHIFFLGQPYMLETFARGVVVPVEPIGDFFPLLVSLNKRVEPDKSPPILPRRTRAVRRLTDENPLEAVLTRLQQFTSVQLAAKLVERRASTDDVALAPATVASKSVGLAFAMRNALDYIAPSSGERLNKRILGLYYGVMAFAQAEMLAAPTGPVDLDEVEGMTKQGHGLYTLAGGRFGDLKVGVLATGFLPQWLSFLGHDTSEYPRQKPRSGGDLQNLPQPSMVCTLRDLFASMPEIDDLFAEVFGGPAGWLAVRYDNKQNQRLMPNASGKKPDSTYGLFIDRSKAIPVESVEHAGWPLAEIQGLADGAGYRARVDHAGHDVWWDVLPTHSSPYGKSATLLLPSLGGMREYRTIAAATLYALSIIVRYMPSAWRRVEGGDEDQYLAIVRAALHVWERVLPEQFLESIAGEVVRTAQPGSWL